MAFRTSAMIATASLVSASQVHVESMSALQVQSKVGDNLKDIEKLEGYDKAACEKELNQITDENKVLCVTYDNKKFTYKVENTENDCKASEKQLAIKKKDGKCPSKGGKEACEECLGDDKKKAACSKSDKCFDKEEDAKCEGDDGIKVTKKAECGSFTSGLGAIAA